MNSKGSVPYRVSLALGLVVFLFSAVGVQAEEPQQGIRIFLPSIVGGNATGSQEVDESIDHTYLVSQEEAETDHEASDPPDVVHQDETAAQAADVAIIAQESGLSTAQIEASLAFQDAFAQYADDLIARYPDQISAVWIEPDHTQRGHIQFTENIPAAVNTEAEVASNPALQNVVLSGDGVVSLAEHELRTELASAALAAQGYQNTVTFFDPATQKIHVEILLPPEAVEPSQAEVALAVQTHVAAAAQAMNAEAAAVAAPLNLELTVFRGSGPLVIADHTRGGTWMRDDGARECTSAFAASNNLNGSRGILTAGHCDGLNQFEEPGVPLYSAPFIKQVYGATGDAEFHTTPSHGVYDDFYASATDIRDVTDIRTTSTMVGASVCLYGRKSNVRTCTHSVQSVTACVNYPNIQVCKLARTSSTSSIPGDSGGPWSFGTVAWGINSGHDTLGRGYFTPVQQVQSALGVTILR